ncbi:MAG: NTP transferase domain-containing protein [Planctomycetes bacterium]|nr:NTP transferase domain-containing protein [Planctomycetota bacterium]
MTLPPPLPSHTLDRTAPKQAVILAAGVGSRLGTSALEKPKCLLPLSHKTLLEIQIETYLSIGVEEVCVVVGYRKELIEPVVKRYPNTITIENPIYANSTVFIRCG